MGRVLPSVLVLVKIRIFNEHVISEFLKVYFKFDCLMVHVALQHTEKYQAFFVLFWHPVCVQLPVPQG